MLMVFTGIEKARFRRPVVPGDQLRIEVVLVKAWRITAARLEGKAYVDGKVAAEELRLLAGWCRGLRAREVRARKYRFWRRFDREMSLAAS